MLHCFMDDKFHFTLHACKKVLIWGEREGGVTSTEGGVTSTSTCLHQHWQRRRNVKGVVHERD